MKHILALGCAGLVFMCAALVCRSLTGEPGGFSSTTATVLPFVFAAFAYYVISTGAWRQITSSRAAKRDKQIAEEAKREIEEVGYSWKTPVLCPHCGKAQPAGREKCSECGRTL
jgi:hypothetical protein